MKTIYIAGPFRGANAWGRELNIRAAEAVAWREAGAPAPIVWLELKAGVA